MRKNNPQVLWVILLNNKTPHLVVMSDEERDLKISLIVVGHIHCTHRTATDLMKKLHLGLEETGDGYGRLLVTTDKCG